jgi:DNA-binding XRE family transcriptional regulator
MGEMMNKSFEEMLEELRNSEDYFFYKFLYKPTEQIYAAFKKSKLTKKDFAKSVGISVKTLNKIFEGFHNTDLKTLWKICKEYNIKIMIRK